MSNTPHLAKKILRKEIRGLIAQQMAAEGNWENIREKESASVVKKLFNNEWFLNAKRLSIYISNEQEICTDDVVRKALREGKEVFIPRFKKGAERMEMLRLESETEFDSLESTLWGSMPQNTTAPRTFQSSHLRRNSRQKTSRLGRHARLGLHNERKATRPWTRLLRPLSERLCTKIWNRAKNDRISVKGAISGRFAYGKQGSDGGFVDPCMNMFIPSIPSINN